MSLEQTLLISFREGECSFGKHCVRSFPRGCGSMVTLARDKVARPPTEKVAEGRSWPFPLQLGSQSSYPVLTTFPPSVFLSRANQRATPSSTSSPRHRATLSAMHAKKSSKDPVRFCSSGHCTCRKCYKTVSLRHFPLTRLTACPTSGCRKAFNHYEVRPYADSVGAVSGLKVRCPAEGCSWTGSLKDRATHTEHIFNAFKCPNEGCSFRGTYVDIEVHRDEECPKEHVQCARGGDEGANGEAQEVGVCELDMPEP